jgi:hypothetical protein
MSHDYLPRVTAANTLRPFVVEVTFSNGLRRRIDLAPRLRDRLRGPIFEPLNDPAYFKQMFVEGPGIAWPNGASIAPETLYELGTPIEADDASHSRSDERVAD